MVKIKDPIEYLKRLEFHKNSKNYEDYFFNSLKFILMELVQEILKRGWAAIILNDSNQSNVSGSESNTTNNRMELMAPIMALKKKKEIRDYYLRTQNT